MKKHFVFLDLEGGTDKISDIHRQDTFSILNALEAMGWTAERLIYSEDKKTEQFQKILTEADGVVNRIRLIDCPQKESYLQFIESLSQAGIKTFPSAKTLINFETKNALCSLSDTPLVPTNTFSYHSADEFSFRFPRLLSKGDRFLKQSQRVSGKGIWHIQVNDPRPFDFLDILPLDTQLICHQIDSRKKQRYSLGEFIQFCNQRLIDPEDLLVDMPYLPRHTEGVLRVFMLSEHPILIQEYKPAQIGFFAALRTDLSQDFDTPDKWPALIGKILPEIPKIKARLGLPLLWTADFIRDEDTQGNTSYVMVKVNASRVDFHSEMNTTIPQRIAETLIKESLRVHEGSLYS